MTPEEVRAEVVERLARAEYMKDCEMIPDMLGMSPLPVWEEAPEAARQEHRRFVGHLIDALDDMIPTGLDTRTIVHIPDGGTEYAEIGSRSDLYGGLAEHWQEQGGRVEQQRCWTHDWQEAPE